jgi:hypothetical protein
MRHGHAEEVDIGEEVVTNALASKAVDISLFGLWTTIFNRSTRVHYSLDRR